MELVTTCIAPVCNVLVGWVSPNLMNMWYLEKNMDECETSKNSLNAKRDHVECHKNLEEINIENWFNRYQDINTRYSEFHTQFSEYQREERWSRVRLIKRYKFSQEVIAMMEEIKKLIDEAGEMPPPIVERENTQCTSDFLPSMEKKKKEVYKALEEQNVNVIGVFGMGGIGKTTLMQQINNEMVKRSDFKLVIMVTVSQNLDINKIQYQIERRLPKNNVGGTMDDGQRSPARANIISRRLEKVKGDILIIFDDVWEPLDFTEIGIPSPNKSCKIILTTRNQTVCETMGAKEINIVALGTDESWKLFESINVGSNKDVNLEVKHEVCKECAGLPLAISVVAKLLNNNKFDNDYWRRSLEYLKTADPVGMGGRNGIVYKSVKLSYDSLEEERLKNYFLLCSLFPEDCEIDFFDLICYGIEENKKWEKYVKKGIDSLNDFLDIFKHLRSRGLILEQRNQNTARMHDIVRDVAINIAEEKGFFIKTGVGLEELPQFNDNNEFKWISLMDNSFKDIKQKPQNVERLEFLSLKGNKELKRIGSNFFKGMRNLLFLDLRETSISDLTPCIQKLENLRVLMHRRNGFSKIPIPIEHLVQLGDLSVLCLQNSKIKELVKEFGRLVKLRVIDFTGTEIDIIRSKVFSSLENLEVLYMHGSFHDWKASNDEDEDCVAFEELSTLKHLYALRVDIKNKDIFSVKYRVAGNFSSIKHFSIRSNFEDLRLNMIMDCNYLILNQNIENIAEWVKLLLIKTKKLQMIVNSQHSVHALMNPDFQNYIHNLEILKIEYGSNYKNVIQLQKILPKLQQMYLSNGKGLDSMIATSSKLPAGSFQGLVKIVISFCKDMKYLFTWSVAVCLVQLEELKIDDCHKLKHVIGNDSNNTLVWCKSKDEKIMFPKLKWLHLSSLPSFECMCAPEECPDNMKVQWASMEYIHVALCRNWKPRLIFGQQSVPVLREFECEKEWFEQLNWEDEDTKKQIQSVFKLSKWFYLRVTDSELSEIIANQLPENKMRGQIVLHEGDKFFPNCFA